MEIGFIGPRHPQSTRPMKSGRPVATGPFKTRAQLVEAVLKRSADGKNSRNIARTLGVSHSTITKIIKEKNDQETT